MSTATMIALSFLPVRDNNMDSTSCALAGSPEWAPDTHFKKVKQGNLPKGYQNADLKHYKPMPAKKVDGAVDTAENGKAGSAENANKAKRIDEEPGSFASTNEAKLIEEEVSDSGYHESPQEGIHVAI
jgi:hypothetical protein